MTNTLKSSHTHSRVPEIYGYNVIYDQDYDILNQGSVNYIKKYFDNKEKEVESNIINSIISPTTHTRKSSDYSVNSTIFFIKIVIFILFVWILWDFINIK